MIKKYISELLYDHECVIVPGLGAFITKEKPAVLDYVNHVLTPPSKEVAFNGQLVSDDGLLVGYVAERQGITTEAAAAMVHEFAMQSLAHDESVRFDDSMNLLGDSFGLPTLKVQPVFRRETYQHIATKITVEQKAKNTLMTVQEEEHQPKPHRVNRYNYRWFRAAAYSMMVAFALVMFGWGADKSDSRLASWNPFFYSSPNEFLAKHLDDRFKADEMPAIEYMPSRTVVLPVCSAADVDYLEPLDADLLKPVDVDFYYIIGASLKNNGDARLCAGKFRKQGFVGAEILPVNSKGNIRVAYEQVMGKEAAIKRLEIIKKEYNEAAWLLRKK